MKSCADGASERSKTRSERASQFGDGKGREDKERDWSGAEKVSEWLRRDVFALRLDRECSQLTIVLDLIRWCKKASKVRTLRNFSTASLATSSRVGLAPK